MSTTAEVHPKPEGPEVRPPACRTQLPEFRAWSVQRPPCQGLGHQAHTRRIDRCDEFVTLLDLASPSGPGAPERGISLAEAAFEFVAGPGGPQLGYVASFPWTCRACGQTISDRRPSGGHPEDDEPGHDEGGPRLAAAVAAYREMD